MKAQHFCSLYFLSNTKAQWCSVKQKKSSNKGSERIKLAHNVQYMCSRSLNNNKYYSHCVESGSSSLIFYLSHLVSFRMLLPQSLLIFLSSLLLSLSRELHSSYENIIRHLLFGSAIFFLFFSFLHIKYSLSDDRQWE